MQNSSEQKQNIWKFSLNSIRDLKQLADSLGTAIDAIEDVSILRQPVEVGSLVAPNSLAVHPMEGCDSDRYGSPGKLTLRRYERFAAGGAGLIWGEAIAVVPEARANPRQLWLNEKNKDSFSAMVKMIRTVAAQSMGKNHRPILVAQLTHSGRYSRPNGFSKPLIPQRDPYRDSLMPQAFPTSSLESRIPADHPIITDRYLDNLQEAYVDAARLAFETGFDAVDIKSCHGYLINELLASRQRKGKYGGSFANRVRFLLNVIDKIHSKLGEDKPVVSRLNFYDGLPFPYGWGVNKDDYSKPDLTEPKKLIKLMIDRGLKMINFTAGNPYCNPHMGRPFNQPVKSGYQTPEHPLIGVARLIELAGQIQQQFPELVIVGTGYTWLRHLMGNVAAATKASGKAKIIGAGRMAFAYPDFAKDLLTKGKLDKNKVCVSCSGCTQLMRDGQMTGCVVRDNRIYGPKFEQGRLADKANLNQLALNCFHCQEPTCQLACPAGIDIPAFIQQFLDGHEKGAYETIRKANILPEVCAWLCPVENQCQGHCLQNFIGDGAVPIAAIQRYLAEQANKNGWSKLRIPKEPTNKKVAILGAGPAGISAAATLLEAGHCVTIFDKSKEFGGMIESVIAPDKQNSSLKNEIKAIFADVPEDRMKLRLGTELKAALNLDSVMSESFDAAFIGLGLPKASGSSENRPQDVYDALTFLALAKTEDSLTLENKTVAVIGGGSTAMDVAVTAKQLAAGDVYLIYRRSFTDMPAWSKEKYRALNEDVHFVILTQLLGYQCHQDKLTGIIVCPTKPGALDASGRRRPELVESSAYVLNADIVVEAIGQQSLPDLANIVPGVETDNGLIKTKPDSFETSRKGIFAAGDIVTGPSTVVAAVADGMAAAKRINVFLKTESKHSRCQ